MQLFSTYQKQKQLVVFIHSGITITRTFNSFDKSITRKDRHFE